MIEKPKQYFDTRSHQLYYQWDESEYFSHQEPIYDRTREYIESLEAENAKLQASNEVIAEDHAALCEQNAKLRELVLHMVECVRRLDGTSEDGGCSLCPYQSIDYDCEFENRARDLGVEVDG